MLEYPSFDKVQKRLKFRLDLNEIELKALLDERQQLLGIQADLCDPLDKPDPEARLRYFNLLSKGA